MQHILLCPNLSKDPGLVLTHTVAKTLLQFGLEVYISDKYPLDAGVNYYADTIPHICECLIVIGGDGTVIDVLPTALDNDIPVLGINLGKVGYLAEVEPTELHLLALLSKDEFLVENKILLECDFVCNNTVTHLSVPVLNDISVSRRTENPIASIRVRYNGKKALDYRADGVILATPQGATAYSLSCGGPMLSHELSAISLTPIAPHSFFNRSMVFSDTAVFEIENMDETPLLMIADGKGVFDLPFGSYIRVYKSQKTLKMISLKKEGQIQSIFRKLRRIENI